MPILTIAVAEWFGTALWFTPNAIIPELTAAWSLVPGDIAWLTGAVQLGFLLGTLFIGLSGVADRHDASRLFAGACLLGAVANGLLVVAGGLWPALFLRLITGLALAGIYPIGMKLMVGWAPGRAGLGLAWLVGMLVLGTATPHLLTAFDWQGDWRPTLWTASGLALLAGVMVHRLGEATPATTTTTATSQEPPATAISRFGGLAAFRLAEFRRAALAYFGHMWELYTLWALIPLLLSLAVPALSSTQLAIGAFVLIAVGAPGCWLGGLLSLRFGSRAIATAGLAGSALCAALYPLLATRLDPTGLIALLAIWSLLAVIDSPHFSALAARACPAPLLGSALTLQNAIGFGISALSIALLVPLLPHVGVELAWWLLPGPLVGLLALYRRQA
ncbi:MFS transporter [Salinicola avicenniae]|uniref:MFS transporter n=1 Tax=Salinicola avicenniae TaxID=2916836 RepID=UPI002073D6E3|nr:MULTISPECIES: MFS transporter [unclassified Salinicola]